ncbi:MAG: hypothetical protein ABIG71_04960, partial [Candidatus Uhrbacteria bacterium]
TQQPAAPEATPTASFESKIYVMPSQFLELTRAKGLPLAAPVAMPSAEPPKPVAVPTPQVPAVVAAPVPISSKPVVSAPQQGGAQPRQREALGAAGVLQQPDPNAPQRTMFYIWIAVAAVLLIGGGIAAFVVLRSVEPAVAPAVVAPTPAPPVPAAPRVVQPTVPTPAPVTTPVIVAPIIDADGDGLTADEELLFGSDDGLTDTDGDGYSDAVEISNFYNPASSTPGRLLDTGMIYEYTHPSAKWQTYVPRAWTVTAHAETPLQVFIGESEDEEGVSVTTEENPNALSITDWLNQQVVARALAPLQEMENARGTMIYSRADEPRMAWAELSDGQFVTIEQRLIGATSRFDAVFAMIVSSFAP